MDVSTITPLILTYNEEPNLPRVLERLAWARQILVVDSGSTDGTLALLAQDARVRVLHRPFDSFAAQCNFGLEHIRTEWVLSLDADYVLSEALVAELPRLLPPQEVAGYEAAFDYWVLGGPLRASLYPPRKVLYRRALARYENDGHAHRVQLQGAVERLHGRIAHDDRKPFSRWLAAQDGYAVKEVGKLLHAERATLRLQDRLRLTLWAAAPAAFVYTLFVKGMLLDGWRGWYYTLQRTLAEIVLALRLVEKKLSS